MLALPDENILADYHDYFTDEELDAYLPEFIEEGTVDDRLVILPLAKSTEILFVNKTAFDRFAAETGAALDELSTWEGLYAMAERYAEWSGGKSFFVHDYHFNYFQVGVESLGENFFDKDGIAFGPCVYPRVGALRQSRADRRTVAGQRLCHRTAAHRRCDRIRCLVCQVCCTIPT